MMNQDDYMALTRNMYLMVLFDAIEDTNTCDSKIIRQYIQDHPVIQATAKAAVTTNEDPIQAEDIANFIATTILSDMIKHSFVGKNGVITPAGTMFIDIIRETSTAALNALDTKDQNFVPAMH